MKFKLILFNILLLGVFIPFIGGGAFYKLGYFFLLVALLLSYPLFGNIAKSSLFNKGTIYLYLFLLFYLFSSMLDVLGCVALFGRLCAPIFCILLISIIRKYPQLINTQRFFIIVWLLVLCFFEIQSIKFLAENPIGLRELISTKKDDSLFIGGGFSLPYAFALLVPALFLFFKLTKKSKRIVFIGFCILFSALVFLALYMTAIIIMLFGIFLALIHNCSRSKKILIFFFLVVSVFLLYDFIPLLIEEYQPEGTSVLLKRYQEMDSLLSGNSVSESEDFFSRIQLSIKSIITFLENPFLGIGWQYKYDFFELERAGVGSHAQWFDIFACYGLFALLLIGYLKNSLRPFMKKDNIALTLFVLLGFLNPCLQFTILFVTYCLVPMIRTIVIQADDISI